MRKTTLAAATAIFFVSLSSGADAKNMADVLGQCQDQRPFPQYAACVKSTYAAKGELKSSGPVMAFFAYFDELVENFEKSQGGAEPMTEARARAETFRIWQATIEADDKARRTGSVVRVQPTRDDRPTSCIPTPNGGMNCMKL